MWSNDFIKIPFAERGRSRAEGVDCWGLARIIYKELLNIDLPSLLDYVDTDDRLKISQLYNSEHNTWIDIKQGDEKEFDIIIFKMNGLPTHVGIVISKDTMIHCERGSGVSVVNFRKENQWYRRIIGIYRHGQCISSNITSSI